MSALERFRARFAGVADHTDAPESIEARWRACLELHALNLLLDIERAKRSSTTLEDAVAQANRDRVAAAPMPSSLAARWSELHGI
ncbi:MAG: hypothetical protein KC503_35905 [Myxococcales bacterium]|nr:hypothetical protein [Myxococcales bacterium]